MFDEKPLFNQQKYANLTKNVIQNITEHFSLISTNTLTTPDLTLFQGEAITNYIL